ncbi:MAG TPA: ABC transporter ATP-binding protein, partial [Pyrinomonadaceae bacterium]
MSKRYRIGALHPAYQTFREAVVDAVASRLRRLGRGRAGAAGNVLWALDGVSLEVRRGEILGIVGRNGAGKSTLLKILSRITRPSAGQVELYGRVGSLLEVGTGFHPDLTGRENIFLNGAILGMRKVEIEAKFDEIVAFSELERFVETPVKFYSSGMYVRLAFSVAAHLEPEILIMDEVLAVGDRAFQQKCLDKMGEVRQQGRTIFFVSHNLPAITRLCKRAVLLDGGRLVADGPPQEVVNRYLSGSWKAGAARVWEDGDAPANLDLALARTRDAREDFEQRRFARAVVADDADEVAAPDLQSHAAQGPELLAPPVGQS